MPKSFLFRRFSHHQQQQQPPPLISSKAHPPPPPPLLWLTPAQDAPVDLSVKIAQPDSISEEDDALFNLNQLAEVNFLR